MLLTLTHVVGSYLLLDSLDTKPGVSAQITSPLTTPSSSACLELTFHYYLYGTSTTMQISVHTITTGKRKKGCTIIIEECLTKS